MVVESSTSSSSLSFSSSLSTSTSKSKNKMKKSQQIQQNFNSNEINTKPKRKSDDAKRAELLLEASTTNITSNDINNFYKFDQGDYENDNENSNSNRKSNGLHEIDLNLLSDISDDSSSLTQPSSSSSDFDHNNIRHQQFVNNHSQMRKTVKSENQVQQLDSTSIQQLINDQVKSYLILDDKEILQVNSASEFVSLFRTNCLNKLNIDSSLKKQDTSADLSTSFSSLPLNSLSASTAPSSSSSHANSDDRLVKCVSIFGNTGDGKSHSLNHTFFNGRNIFRTSNRQEACTMGVWCAYDPNTNALIFDTEGMLGTTTNEIIRMRLLLKVLAISDIVIYRTRAERLHNDLFKFLSDASDAYLKYFSKELKQAQTKLKLDTISSLGPCCVIFHETQHTDVLSDEIDQNGHQRTVAHQLADRFTKLGGISYEAFSSIEYVGTRTSINHSNVLIPPGQNINFNASTDFTKLARNIRDLLRNNSVRPPRKLSSIYQVLKVLNDKFNGIIAKNQISSFADEYFTCSSVCLSCG